MLKRGLMLCISVLFFAIIKISELERRVQSTLTAMTNKFVNFLTYMKMHIF